jgi:molybdenum cofactor biosynthesis protein B
MSYKDHKRDLNLKVQCFVLTVSDTRSKEEDRSGQLIINLLKDSSHTVLSYEIVKDDPETITKILKDQAENSQIQAIIINGGTGISNRDVTFEAVESLLEKKLDGFGEVFRFLSYQEIGSPAIMSRAVAGIFKGRVLFSVPGSVHAVHLAMEKLILPELGHIVALLKK